ncbi:unnamed protein product, partial [Arabidopsis halleri]
EWPATSQQVAALSTSTAPKASLPVYTWLYPLKKKSDVKLVFIAFKALVENKLQQRIGTLFSDNGGEFLALREFLSTSGVSHLTSPPHTPEHNGISERKHRHVVESGLTLLSQASIPTTYWTYAFATAVYLINRLITPVLSQQSPFFKLFGTHPNYAKLKVFGCLCFPWLKPYTRHKLESRSQSCVFLGYSLTQSAYFCLHVPSGRIYTSRHVVFEEEQFPFSGKTISPSPAVLDNSRVLSPIVTPVPVALSTPMPINGTPSSDLHPSSSSSSSSPSSPPQVSPSNSNSSSSSTPSSEPTAPNKNGPQTQAQQSQNNNEPTALQQNESTPTVQPSPTATTSGNQQTVSSNSQNAQQHEPQNPQPNQPPENIHKMQTRAKNNISKPKQKLNLHVVGNSQSREPRTVVQAMKDERWRASMSDEYNAQLANHSWDLVPPQPTQNVIGSRWVFTIKYHPDGRLQRYKSRLVAKGFHQRYGVDYAETFSPVIKSTTIRLVLDIAVASSWPIKQLDVNNAFLQGELTEEVYMTQPQGFIDKDRPQHVCKLRKPIYGLKQAPRAWYMALKTHLLRTGFSNSLADTSLFIKHTGKSFVYVLVYVDDILVTGNDNSLIAEVLRSFSARFSIKDPTDLTYFLGIEATRTKAGLHLMQRKYIVDLLTKNNMLDAKPALTPLPVSPKLTLRVGSILKDPSQYRSVIGS